jgi:hypothetical protein
MSSFQHRVIGMMAKSPETAKNSKKTARLAAVLAVSTAPETQGFCGRKANRR